MSTKNDPTVQAWSELRDTLEIPEFLRKPKQVVTLEVNELNRLIKKRAFIGFLRGIIMGAVAIGLLYVVYMTCFVTHMLPMAGP